MRHEPSDDEEGMLTVGQVAIRLSMVPMTVYRLIHAGKLKAVQVNRNYRISEVALASFMLERETRG